MNNPRDFLPAKYKKNQMNEGLINKSSNVSFFSNNIKNQQKKSNTKLAKILVFLFLIVGLFSSYLLSKEGQDSRQQASEPSCLPGEPYCVDGRCISGYIGNGEECISIDSEENPNGTCGPNTHHLNNGDPDKCYHSTCRDTADGGIICGFITDDDPCTSESMGGDWCDDPNTTHTESCEEAGLIRCHCGGTGNGWWVIGSNDNGCSDLCEDANAVCEDCEPPDEPPNNPPTGTPTPPPEPLVCGSFDCNQNSDCALGLTCQPVVVNGQDKKICGLGENQLFCAATPNVENCCESQAIPVCASIEILDSSNNIMTASDDAKLKNGDEIRFRCSAVGNQDVDFDFQFRVWAPNTNFWTDLTDTSGSVEKNISDAYIINNLGHYTAQGRICVGSNCQAWEIVAGSPSTSSANTQ